MPLTITINEAAPGTLTIGVGTPGVGVPNGGSTGTVLKKLSGADYDTGWASDISGVAWGAITGTLSTQTDLQTALNLKLASSTAASTYQTLSGMSSYLTTSTAASTYQTLAGMSSYLALAGGTMSGTLIVPTIKNVLNTNLVVDAYNDSGPGTHNYFNFNPYGGGFELPTSSAGIKFGDATVQTTAAISGDRYLTTSTTSNTIGNGAKTFTVGTGLSYTPTQDVTISYDASKHMHAEVTTYNSGTGVLVVDVKNHTGSGTFAAWKVNVGGVTPLASVAWGSITGTLSTQTDLQNALDLKLDISTAASTYYLQTNPSGFIGDAPSDGSTYGRNNGAWAVAGGGYITSVTAPLSVTANDLSVDLSAYLSLTGGTLTGTITFPHQGPGINSALSGSGLLVELNSDNIQRSQLTYNSLAIYPGGMTPAMQVTPTGLTFPDATTQSSAGYPASGNPSGFLTDAPSDGSTYGRNNGTWAVPPSGISDAPSDGSLYARQNLAWASFTPGVSASPYSNAVWYSGGWYSANVTSLTDGYGNYYNALTI